VTLPQPAAEFVTAGRVARLATADANGRPLVVPVCYAFDGECWYSAVDAKPKRAESRRLKRVRNIEANPRVSVVVDHYDEDWRRLRYVIIQGLADLLVGGREFAYAIDLLVAKYPQYRELGLSREAGLVIRVRPESFAHWTYAT
jgi:PPOX class probable F420-dependent enzyme